MSRVFFESCVGIVVGTTELENTGSFSGQCRIEGMGLASLSSALVSLFSVLWDCCTRRMLGCVWEM